MAALSAPAEPLSSAAASPPGRARSAEPWLAIVGLGEDGRAGLSPAAAAALDRADLVVGGARHLALVAPLAAATLAWPSPMEAAYDDIPSWRAQGRVCVLATGDPFHHGVGPGLAARIAPGEWVCFPGISAFSLAAARLGWSLPDCELVSVHGRALERVVPHLQPGARILALSTDGETPGRLAAFLVARGFGGAVLTVLERMGGPRETIRHARAAAFALDGIDPLNTVAMALPPAAGDARAVPLAAGLDDAWFAHDGQLTKAEIRAVTLAALAPRAGELLWDVGAGAGSVAIEWCLRHPRNRAVAIEARTDRAVRLEGNARDLGVVDRVAIVAARAPDALHGLATPQAIFVGGGASDPGVFEAAWAALGSGGRIVVNAVTLETETALAGLHARHGGLLRRIAVSRLVPVGVYHGWRPAMPVMQWVAGKAVKVSAVKVVAGVGFRSGAPASEIVALVRQALVRAALGAGDLQTLATAAGLADRAAFRAAARDLEADPVAVDEPALAAVDGAVETRSDRALAAHGVGSVAEAAALGAAGPGARLILARISSRAVTCALAAHAEVSP